MGDDIEDIDDAVNITGISELLNYSGSENLSELERGVIDGNVERPKAKSEVESFKDKLNSMGSAFGHDGEYDFHKADGGRSTDMYNGGGSVDDRDSGAGSDDSDGDDDDDDDDDVMSVVSASTRGSRYISSKDYGFDGNARERATQEKRNQTVVNDVMSTMNHSSSAFIEKEIEMDSKAIMTENISSLAKQLADMGISTDDLPSVSPSSSIDDIRAVNKTITLRYDRARYSDTAEDVILAVTSGLERVCNGTRKMAGFYPDLTGLSAETGVRLRRLRYHTSTFVSNIMRDHEFSHGARIAIDLIPLLFTNLTARKSKKSDTLHDSKDMNSMMAEIRKIDEGDK